MKRGLVKAFKYVAGLFVLLAGALYLAFRRYPQKPEDKTESERDNLKDDIKRISEEIEEVKSIPEYEDAKALADAFNARAKARKDKP